MSKINILFFIVRLHFSIKYRRRILYLLIGYHKDRIGDIWVEWFRRWKGKLLGRF